MSINSSRPQRRRRLLNEYRNRISAVAPTAQGEAQDRQRETSEQTRLLSLGLWQPIPGGCCNNSLSVNGRNQSDGIALGRRGDGSEFGHTSGSRAGDVLPPAMGTEAEGKNRALENAEIHKAGESAEGTTLSTSDENGFPKRSGVASVSSRYIGFGNIEEFEPLRSPRETLTSSSAPRIIKYLQNVAIHCWPRMPKHQREEIIQQTLVDMARRQQREELHNLSWWAKWMYGAAVDAYNRNKEDPRGDAFWASEHATYSAVIELISAKQIMRLLKYLPADHHKIALLRIDGANPVEISEELRLPVLKVLRMLADIGRWLSDGGCYLFTK